MANYQPDRLYWIQEGVVKHKVHHSSQVYTLSQAKDDKAAQKITTPLYILDYTDGNFLWLCWTGKASENWERVPESKIPASIRLYRLLEADDGQS